MYSAQTRGVAIMAHVHVQAPSALVSRDTHGCGMTNVAPAYVADNIEVGKTLIANDFHI